jgi:hypothetical protein
MGEGASLRARRQHLGSKGRAVISDLRAIARALGGEVVGRAEILCLDRGTTHAIEAYL